VFAQFGVEISVAEARGPMGMAKRDHIKTLMAVPRIAAAWQAAHGAAPDDAAIDRVYEVFVPMNESVVADYAVMIEGAVPAVERLRARGMKIGSTTGYTRSIMERVLPVAAAQGYAPDNLVCADDLPEGRPGPLQMYQTFIDLRVYPPSAVIKVDDTEPGIAEGVAAGCLTVGVAMSGNIVGLTPEDLAATDPAEVDRLRAVATARLKAAGADHVIDSIADLRNMSTHLIMPELGVAYSPIFQAGVVNFIKTYKAWTGKEVLPAHAVGLLTLTTGAKAPSSIDLSTKYGEGLGEQISAIIDQVNFQIEADMHPEFAIVVKHQMRFASGSDADFTLEQLMALDGKVAFIERPRDATDDLLPGQVVDAVNKMLKEQLPLDTRRVIFTYKGKVSDTMNKTDFTVLCEDQKWKSANNEFHQHHGPLNRGTFTIKCVHWIVDKLKTDQGYLVRRKESYMAKIKPGTKKRR